MNFKLIALTLITITATSAVTANSAHGQALGQTTQKPYTLGKTIYEVPRLPAYTGHHVFKYSVLMTRLTRGTGFEMGFDSKDDAQDVVAWYKDALKANGWSVSIDPKNPCTIMAMQPQDHSVFTAMVRPAMTKGMKCLITIGYQPY